MNRCLCVWVGSILAVFSFAGITAGQASPPVPPAATIPPQALNATNEAPYAKDIKKFIDEQLSALTGADFAAQTTARDALRHALGRGATPAYYSTFAKDWSAASAAIIAKNPPLAVRLNIAIVTSTLTDDGQTLDALPLVLQLLNDREPCVMLWGIKAAKPLVIVLTTNPPAAKIPGGTLMPAVTASPLPPAIVSAVKKCGKSDVSGFAAADAYSALVVKEIPGMAAAQVKPLLKPLVDSVLDILEFRVSQHADGAVQSPGAERDISTWLSGEYADLNAAQKTRLVQLLVDLETYAGKRTGLYESSKKDLYNLREMLKYVASALKVIGGTNVGNKLDWLTSIPPAAPPAQINTYAQQVFAAMSPVVPGLVAPPPIKDIEPPSPATKPIPTVATP